MVGTILGSQSMSSGKCLCGSVTWKIRGKPVASYHCHCSMCRKAHGAAFGTYYFVASEDFSWTSDQDTIIGYQSSPELTRTFCGSCGSVVPGSDDSGKFIYVPAGCHDKGPGIDAHIFVGSKAPWYDITGNLPHHETNPPTENLPVYERKSLADAEDGIVRGSCLCGAIKFHVLSPFLEVHNCHCSRCRQARAAAHASNGFVHMDDVVFTQGEEHIASYKLTAAKFFTHVFCDICGSVLPRVDSQRKFAVVPLGSLDDDPGCKPADNIYVGNKAGWYDITDNLPAYEEGPPG